MISDPEDDTPAASKVVMVNAAVIGVVLGALAGGKVLWDKLEKGRGR